MFSRYLILILGASFASVQSIIPDYIDVCKKNDPKIDQCIINSINKLRGKVAQGIPELEAPPIDPLHLSHLSLDLGPGFKAEGKDLELRGAENYTVDSLVVDLEKDSFDITLSIPRILIKGTYDVDAKIASIPLQGNGPITITATGVKGRAKLQGKRVPKDGKTLFWFPTLDLKLQLDDYSLHLERLFAGSPEIGEATNKLLNELKSEVIAAVLPSVEKAMSELILRIGNNICKHFTYEELFPAS